MGGVFTARQDYFTHFEPSQSSGGAKTGYPREKTTASRTWLVSHMTRALGSNPQR